MRITRAPPAEILIQLNWDSYLTKQTTQHEIKSCPGNPDVQPEWRPTVLQCQARTTHYGEGIRFAGSSPVSQPNPPPLACTIPSSPHFWAFPCMSYCSMPLRFCTLCSFFLNVFSHFLYVENSSLQGHLLVKSFLTHHDRFNYSFLGATSGPLACIYYTPL